MNTDRPTESVQPEASQDLREQTDKSLQEERSKADDHLEHQIQGIEENSDDQVRDIQRKGREREELGLPSARKEEEARARVQERFHKELISETEALLQKERQETDSSLLEERVHIDAELVTRNQLLAIVSHDLQNSIAGIAMRARMIRVCLSGSAMETDTALEHIAVIEQATTGMDRLIRDLLDVERMAHDTLLLTPERCDLLALLQECARFFEPLLAGRSFSMTNVVPPEPLFIQCDHDRIRQVLSNLIGNAIKFTPPGGEIALSLRKREHEVEVSVADDGPGIAPEQREKIFEQFSQLGVNDRRGLGLGLFIAKWIVQTHNGRIWVISDLGKGSTFHFTLPLQQRSEADHGPHGSR